MAKIMLVEDDNNLREIYEARLQAEGYDIVSAQDGEEALVIAKNEKPNLIISDVMMPKISGFEMLDILRNTDGMKDTKVIMLTALGQAEDQVRANSLGADLYLVKSQVTLEDIVKAAHDLLGESETAASTPAEATPEATPDASATAASPAAQVVPEGAPQQTAAAAGTATPPPVTIPVAEAPVAVSPAVNPAAPVSASVTPAEPVTPETAAPAVAPEQTNGAPLTSVQPPLTQPETSSSPVAPSVPPVTETAKPVTQASGTVQSAETPENKAAEPTSAAPVVTSAPLTPINTSPQPAESTKAATPVAIPVTEAPATAQPVPPADTSPTSLVAESTSTVQPQQDAGSSASAPTKTLDEPVASSTPAQDAVSQQADKTPPAEELSGDIQKEQESTQKEQAEVQDQINSFVDSFPPMAKEVPPSIIPPSPTLEESTAAVNTASNDNTSTVPNTEDSGSSTDKLMNDAVNELIASTESATDTTGSSTASGNPDAATVVAPQQPIGGVPDSSPKTDDLSATESSQPQSSRTSAEVKESAGHQRVIKPLSTAPKPDITTLLALEEAKEAAETQQAAAQKQVQQPTVVISDTTQPLKDPAAPSSPLTERSGFDPNNIAL